jgi:hypothetical protein
VRGRAITSVVGDPDLAPAEEKRFRRQLVLKALGTLRLHVEEPLIVP